MPAALLEVSPMPKVAVVGAGRWGKNLVRNFADIGALIGIADVNRERAASLASDHGVRALSVAEVLADESIHAVAIAAPAAQHYSLASEALSAGKDVFVEKPLALNSADGELLCEKSEADGRILMVGHLLQYHPVFLRLKELVDTGTLGRIQYLYSNRVNFGQIRREEDILWSFAPHDLSMILSLVRQEPNKVSAVGKAYLHSSIADVTLTHLSFTGGESAHIFVSWLQPYKEQRLVVVGDKAMAVFDDGEPWPSKLQLYPHKVQWRDGAPEPLRGEAEPVAVESAEPLRMECQHFLECVATRQRPRTDGREGLRVLRVLEAASAAARTESEHRAGVISDDRTRPYFVHQSAYVDQRVRIGNDTQIWHFCHVLVGTTIGSNCTIGQNVMLGPDVIVGDHCKIQNNVSLYRGVQLGDGVFCGPSAVFTNVRNPRAEIDRSDDFEPTIVHRGATIGANATIVCGHSIGEYAMIGAGAVVTADVPPHALMVGVPARRRGWVSHDGEVLGPDLVCRRSGRRYRELSADTLEEVT